ncbi:hypothetical protein AMS68_000247 [Peltaster fructicola]|uniref:Transcription factor domain-containing protein n=1 Tax=Peltaster fructicola TaxID=286661 RepID=A0A6H0XJN0_9PEZI|nr:hypothetical protein AMS68_000247 [Peltaster fructicola]
MAEWVQAWFHDLPRLAFNHDNLLYALLAFSGTQMLAEDPSVGFAQAEFWSIALREQRKAIAAPDHNVEAVSLAAYFIVMTGFGILRFRPLSPYSPPLHFFELAQGAINLSPKIEEIQESSIILLATYKTLMPMWDSTLESNDETYQPILSFRLDEEQQSYGGDMATNLNTYKETLNLISRFRRSIVSRDPYYQHQRWIPVLAQAVPKHFLQLLRQERPRALATLACFWTLLLSTDPLVLKSFGDTEGCIPKRELNAITQVLPSGWRAVLTQCSAEVDDS